jgi:hypothetical protein
MVNEDFVDATPHPLFTPKPWPPHCNHKKSILTSVAETSDVEMSDSHDGALFKPGSENPVTPDDSAAESNEPTPCSKKQNAQTVKKAMAKMEVRKSGAKTADKKNVEIVPASDEEQPEEPKPKKVKVKVHNEINIAAKKIKKNKIQNNYGDMVKSMSGK